MWVKQCHLHHHPVITMFKGHFLGPKGPNLSINKRCSIPDQAQRPNMTSPNPHRFTVVFLQSFPNRAAMLALISSCCAASSSSVWATCKHFTAINANDEDWSLTGLTPKESTGTHGNMQKMCFFLLCHTCSTQAAQVNLDRPWQALHIFRPHLPATPLPPGLSHPSPQRCKDEDVQWSWMPLKLNIKKDMNDTNQQEVITEHSWVRGKINVLVSSIPAGKCWPVDGHPNRNGKWNMLDNHHQV